MATLDNRYFPQDKKFGNFLSTFFSKTKKLMLSVDWFTFPILGTVAKNKILGKIYSDEKVLKGGFHFSTDEPKLNHLNQ